MIACYVFGLHATPRVLRTGSEYFSFIALIGSLFVISGGIHINLKGEATPLAVLLAVSSTPRIDGVLLSDATGDSEEDAVVETSGDQDSVGEGDSPPLREAETEKDDDADCDADGLDDRVADGDADTDSDALTHRETVDEALPQSVAVPLPCAVRLDEAQAVALEDKTAAALADGVTLLEL